MRLRFWRGGEESDMLVTVSYCKARKRVLLREFSWYSFANKRKVSRQFWRVAKVCGSGHSLGCKGGKA